MALTTRPPPPARPGRPRRGYTGHRGRWGAPGAPGPPWSADDGILARGGPRLVGWRPPGLLPHSSPRRGAGPPGQPVAGPRGGHVPSRHAPYASAFPLLRPGGHILLEGGLPPMELEDVAEVLGVVVEEPF